MRNQKFQKTRYNFKEELYLLCEGIADKIFFDNLLKNLNLKYKVTIKDCRSKDKIYNVFKKLKSIYSEINILVFIDLDAKGTTNIDNINLQFINNDHETPNIYFVNPVIEYFFVIVKIDKHSIFTKKSDYKQDIKKLYGIENYESSKKDCEKIVSLISDKDWNMFLKRLKKCNINSSDIPSTNITELLDLLVITKTI